MAIDKDRSKVFRTNLLEGTKEKVNTEFFDYVSESTVGPGYSGHGKNSITIKNGPASEGEKSPWENINGPTVPENEGAFNKAWVNAREKMMHKRLENIEQCRKKDLELHSELNNAFDKEIQVLIKEKKKAEMELDLKIMECDEQKKKTEELEGDLKEVEEKLLGSQSELDDVKKKLVEKDKALSEKVEDLKKIDESFSKKDQDIEMRDIELTDLKQKLKEKDGILKQAFAELRKQKGEISQRENELKERESALETEKNKLSAEVSRLKDHLKNEKTKNLEFADFIASTKEKFVKQTNRLSKVEAMNKQLKTKLAKSPRSNNQLEMKRDRELEIDMEVIYEFVGPVIQRKLSFTESEEEGDYLPKMVKIDRKLLEKVKPVGIRNVNQIDVFVRLIESNLVKDGVMLRLDITWDIMTLVRAGIAGWQWMLCNPEEETDQIRALRANRRINWVMGVDTHKHRQVRSVAMLKFGLGVKFTGNHLSRKIQDYPKLLKHNAKVWIISRDFMNVKPSPSSGIKYTESFWNRTKKYSENNSFKARVMPRTSTTPRGLLGTDWSEIMGDSSSKSSRMRQMSLEQRLAANDVAPHSIIQRKRNRQSLSPHSRQRKSSKGKEARKISPKVQRKTSIGEYTSAKDDDSLVSNESEDYLEDSYTV